MFGAGVDGNFCFSCSSGREKISPSQTQVRGYRAAVPVSKAETLNIGINFPGLDEGKQC